MSGRRGESGILLKQKVRKFLRLNLNGLVYPSRSHIAVFLLKKKSESYPLDAFGVTAGVI